MTVSLWAKALFVALVLAMASTARVEGDPTPPPGSFALTGVRVLTEIKVRRLAGKPPRDPEQLDDWAYGAGRRIVDTYHRRGYLYARAFWVVQPDGVVWMHVDEGVMSRIVFEGTSDYQSMLMHVDLSLPLDTFHGPTVELALKELREKYGLQHVSCEVIETDELEPVPTGQEVRQHVLLIHVEQEESFGWGASVGLDSSWGLVPTGSVSVRGVAFDDDSLHADITVAVPYRRYLFDAEPKAQWVHGRLGLAWKLPTIALGALSPFVAGTVALSRNGRSDIGLESYLVLRGGAIGGLVLLPVTGLTVSLGTGVDVVRLYDETTSVAGGPVDDDTVRGLLQFGTEVVLTPRELRQDYRGLLQLAVVGALSEDALWLFQLVADGRELVKFGHHALIFRQHVVYMTGDVRFFDEVTVAGETMRVFFSNRWWLRETAQAEVALRLAIWGDTLGIGAFVDGAVFGDRTLPGVRATGAFGGGPSLHVLFMDLMALDVYYGFGLDRVGFEHNLSFSLQTVF